MTAQIKLMDFCSGQGVNRSNSSTIARICNAALGKKTQFYVPDSVQHHTSSDFQVPGGQAAILSLGPFAMRYRRAFPGFDTPCVPCPELAEGSARTVSVLTEQYWVRSPRRSLRLARRSSRIPRAGPPIDRRWARRRPLALHGAVSLIMTDSGLLLQLQQHGRPVCHMLLF